MWASLTTIVRLNFIFRIFNFCGFSIIYFCFLYIFLHYMKRFFSFFFVLFSIIMFSCDTSLDVKAPYKKIPVIYCLLDQNDEYHFVKVSKLFNGDLDAAEMAKVADSSIADVKSITMEELVDNQVVKTYILKDTLITTKDAGAFYYPNQTVYFFKEPNLNSTSQYRLTVDIGGDKPAVSTISLIENNNVFQGNKWRQFAAQKVVIFMENGKLLPISLDVLPPKFAKRTEVNMYFTYCTRFTDGSYDIDTLKYQLGSRVISNSSAPLLLNFKLDEGTFYSKIVDEIPNADDTPNYLERIDGICFFEVVNGGEDLYYYAEVNSPASAVFQERPPYTNFENGLGIFSARTTFNTFEDFPGGEFGFNLDDDSEEVLIDGEFIIEDNREKSMVEGIGRKGFVTGGAACN